MNWSTRLTLWMVAFCITMTHVNSYVQTCTLDKKVASAFLCQKGCRFAQRGIGGEEERYRELQERKREDPEFMV
ncbi:Hypothetical predicted protein [Mytilus galloprovincialis]|uniref:Uncharacterized protein n=1 Tax=Mytilus galloprovincialis TaxID=29158 RepID=A0A8B6D7I2_MYTGA|nr:Hypothetical predicted protein [Mytilus galloprovincialis]